MKRRRKVFTVIGLLAVLAGAGTLTAFAVPLYQLFCRTTGYAGTTRTADRPADRVLARKMLIRFNSDVNPGLPWRFEPSQGPMTVQVGAPALAYFRVVSQTDVPVTGLATFNVAPMKAGRYFDKLNCFCFSQQTLAPGETAELPVQFFIDPAIADNHHMDDVTTITLSYTFYRAPDQTAANRLRARTGKPAVN